MNGMRQMVERREGEDAVRGIAYGLIFSAPFWVLVLLVVRGIVS